MRSCSSLIEETEEVERDERERERRDERNGRGEEKWREDGRGMNEGGWKGNE